jgi:hypothetical protein
MTRHYSGEQVNDPHESLQSFRPFIGIAAVYDTYKKSVHDKHIGRVREGGRVASGPGNDRTFE